MADRPTSMRYVWLDADPGHDDATAILLAVHCTNIHLLGVSTVHGNTSASCTANNAARCLFAFGAPNHIRVYPGTSKPLLGAPKYAPEIHGTDGLGGVEGLPDINDHEVQMRFAFDKDGKPVRAIEGMAHHIRETWNNGEGSKVTIVSTGPTTNIALFISVYPDLIDAVEELVFMGGAMGLGNYTAVAEFNIVCDPHAAQIVLDAPVKKMMVPLNVSHTAIVTQSTHSRILSPGDAPADVGQLPKPSSNLRHTLSTLVTFFADAYASRFGFNRGPPLHDPLTIAYVSCPDMFTSTRYRVDVELGGTHTSGETVVDIWNYRSCDDSWGYNGKNCLVANAVDVEGFFDLLLQCIERCDVSSPLNAAQ